MTDIANCRAMELMCLQRAKADPANGWKWLGQADRWHALGKREAAWRIQKSNIRQQMTPGPMTMGPNPVGGGPQFKQQG